MYKEGLLLDMERIHEAVSCKVLHVPWISEPWHAASRIRDSTVVKVLFITPFTLMEESGWQRSWDHSTRTEEKIV